MNMLRFITIVKKEFIHVVRDKPSLVIAIMMPLMFTLIFGYAVTTDVNHIEMAVFDADKTFESRELVRKFVASNYFLDNYYASSIKEVEDLVDGGTVKAALVIPSGYARDLKRGNSPDTLLIIDGTDPTIARTVLQSGNLVATVYNMSVISESGFERPELKTRVWYNPNLESTKFIIPGLIGLIMQNITIMLTAFALVREKESGTIEQLIVTPLKPSELILGKMVPYIIIGCIDFMIALFFGTWWFGVKIQGNMMLLLGLGYGFVVCALAIGMLISTAAQNQLQAMQFAFVTILPTVLLSGFMFPREAMPKAILMASNIIPLTYFLNILRGIILKGVGWEFLWKDAMFVGIIGTVLLALAIKRFNKKLD